MSYRLEVTFKEYHEEVVLFIREAGIASLMFHRFLKEEHRPIRLFSPQGTPLMSAENGFRSNC